MRFAFHRIKDVRNIYAANKPHSVEIVTKRGDFLVENKSWNRIKKTLNLQDKGYKNDESNNKNG